MPDVSPPPRKFHSNTIKFVLDEKVAEARDETKRATLISQLCVELDCGRKRLGWIFNNRNQPTVQQLVAAAQVLGVTVDQLIKLEDAPVVPA